MVMRLTEIEYIAFQLCRLDYFGRSVPRWLSTDDKIKQKYLNKAIVMFDDWANEEIRRDISIKSRDDKEVR